MAEKAISSVATVTDTLIAAHCVVTVCILITEKL